MSVATMEGASSRARAGVDWTPYLIGIGIGVLSWVVFVVVKSPLGITTSLSALSGAAAIPVVGAEAVAQNSYWKSTAPALDYGMLFLAGTMLGGFISALMAGRLRVETVPEVWAGRFGPSPAKRYAAAILGGIIAMYGARLANGCTSGNGISGGLQLALSGWTFLIVMFASGIVTAQIMFRKS